jgi:hypothetical protein
MKLLAALILLFTSTLFSSPQENKIELLDNQKAMKQELLKFVSIGEDIVEAKKIMEENGFTGTLIVKRIIKDYVKGDDNAETVSDIPLNFLYCHRHLRSPSPHCARQWEICFVNERDNISNVFISAAQTCI